MEKPVSNATCLSLSNAQIAKGISIDNSIMQIIYLFSYFFSSSMAITASLTKYTYIFIKLSSDYN